MCFVIFIRTIIFFNMCFLNASLCLKIHRKILFFYVHHSIFVLCTFIPTTDFSLLPYFLKDFL